MWKMWALTSVHEKVRINRNPPGTTTPPPHDTTCPEISDGQTCTSDELACVASVNLAPNGSGCVRVSPPRRPQNKKEQSWIVPCGKISRCRAPTGANKAGPFSPPPHLLKIPCIGWNDWFMAKTRTKLAQFYIYDIVFVQLWRVMRAEVSHDFLFFFFRCGEHTRAACYKTLTSPCPKNWFCLIRAIIQLRSCSQ